MKHQKQFAELPMAKRMGLSSAREFKELKRRQLHRIKKMVDVYRIGCAASPAYHDFCQFEDALQQMIDAQSVSKWGR